MTTIILPAVTLWQPWASLVEIRAKPYETRHFKIPERLLGKRVAIHAAARPCFVDFDQDVADDITEAFGRCSWNHWLPRGVIVATTILAESIPVEKVKHDSFGNYGPGRFAWRLEDVRPVKPYVSAKGRQHIGWPWSVPEGVAIGPLSVTTPPSGKMWDEPIVARMLADFPFPEEEARLVVDAHRNIHGLALNSPMMGHTPDEIIIKASDYSCTDE